MKLSASLGLSAILLAQSAAGWTFVWRDAGGHAHVNDGSEDGGDGDSDRACQFIYHAKGQKFEWDRGFWSDCCIRLYTSTTCKGDMAGFSCDDWTKTASVDLWSYKVTNC